MDIKNYPYLVRSLIESHCTEAGEFSQLDNIDEQLIFDLKRHRYLMMTIGWQGERREYESLIHVEIKDGKIWIQSDGTEVGVANELIEAGVPEGDIVLGFKSPFKRKLLEQGHQFNTTSPPHPKLGEGASTSTSLSDRG